MLSHGSGMGWVPKIWRKMTWGTFASSCLTGLRQAPSSALSRSGVFSICHGPGHLLLTLVLPALTFYLGIALGSVQVTVQIGFVTLLILFSLFFKKNFWSEIRYVLVDSQQFSVKCPKMACAPGSGCWGSGCSHPVPCLGGWGRVVVQGVTPGPSKGGLQPRVLKGNTEISDILQTGKWHCRCHLMEGAERWLGWVSGLFKCVFWRWGSCLGGFFYLFVVVWVFYLFMKSLKRKQTYSIWLHMYNMLPWIRWVLTGV